MDPQQGPPPADLLIGQTIGNYLVTQKLGEGGMGSVYLAEHPTIGKKVALKVLHSEFSGNQDVAARFFNEAKAVNDIGHPNIVDIIDFGIIQAGAGREQLVYFIMEYLAGVTLSQLLRTEAPLPPERALAIGMQVGDALGASHKCGIVHRDLKPDNIILLTRHRERDFVKLLDFGIAKLTGDARGSSRTRTGIVMGTPAYMSPEQCEGRDNVDHRTDIYALGIVLYEMLTGRVPFLGEGYGEILVQHLTQPPIPPSQFRMMNAHVEAVVMKALEKRSDMRYPTMDEMMRAMADPVGYVEAHGGIVGFMQRQLMPSSAPIPSVRLTPAPMMTPVPGHLTPYGLHSNGPTTPAPTTLGASAGEVQGKRSKTGFIVAAAVIVAVAIGAVAVVASKKTAEPAGPGHGSEAVAVGSHVLDAGAGSARTVEHPVAVDASLAAVPPDASPDTGSGAGEVIPPILSETVKITFATKPAGAKILINGVELDERTPRPFDLPRGKRHAKIILRLDRYEDIVIDDFVATDDVANDYTFKKKRTQTVPGKGSGAGKGSAKGPGNDTGLMRPE